MSGLNVPVFQGLPASNFVVQKAPDSSSVLMAGAAKGLDIIAQSIAKMPDEISQRKAQDLKNQATMLDIANKKSDAELRGVVQPALTAKVKSGDLSGLSIGGNGAIGYHDPTHASRATSIDPFDAAAQTIPGHPSTPSPETGLNDPRNPTLPTGDAGQLSGGTEQLMPETQPTGDLADFQSAMNNVDAGTAEAPPADSTAPTAGQLATFATPAATPTATDPAAAAGAKVPERKMVSPGHIVEFMDGVPIRQIHKGDKGWSTVPKPESATAGQFHYAGPDGTYIYDPKTSTSKKIADKAPNISAEVDAKDLADAGIDPTSVPKEQWPAALAKAKQFREGKMTEAQGKALQYSERMKLNEDVFKKLEDNHFDAASIGTAANLWAPNIMRSEDAQKYDAARSNWVAAMLRQESGATITPDEYSRAYEQYFPRAGDTKAVVDQKRELRAKAQENMRKVAGGKITKDPELPPTDTLVAPTATAAAVAPAAVAPAAPAAAAPPVVTTQAQYDSLPSGTIYKDSTGKPHKKK